MMYTSKIAPKIAALVGRPGARSMSSTANVWVDKNTRVICQGFTGKQVGRECGLPTFSILCATRDTSSIALMDCVNMIPNLKLFSI